MANTYIAIATTTVGSGGAANIEFTSIPQTYTDLLLKVSARADALQTTLIAEFNSSSSSYTTRYLYGDGSGAFSGNASLPYFGGVNPSTYTANTFGSTEIYIPNYAGSTNKSLSSDSVIENNATAATAAMWAGLWSNTAAITSIKLTIAGSANFVQYSTATLYGIKKD
jgi:hypothetical protein